MKVFSQKIWTPSEYRHPLSYGFIPTMTVYLHEDDHIRPCMVIAPGGGYEYLSSCEGEPVALEFYQRGYHAVVCTYTTNLATTIPVGSQAMLDLSRTIRILRSGASELKIDPRKIVVCGFSAGGHLCGSLCTHYEDIDDLVYSSISNRPDAAILAYPVITSGEYAHKESFLSLLGKDATMQMLDYFSLEKHVTPTMPPCFLWQTMHDAIVPVENSRLFADACRLRQIPYAHHIFTTGAHGISLANGEWATGIYGGDYVEEQCVILTNLVRQGILKRPERDAQELDRFDHEEVRASVKYHATAVPEVAMWPELADQWLRGIFA